MSTTIRPEVSKRNEYYISKHRYYELKHFCLQYPEWKKKCADLRLTLQKTNIDQDRIKSGKLYSDPVADAAMRLDVYERKIRMVDKTIDIIGSDISSYILKAVTEGRSFTNLQMLCSIPCGRDYFYKSYRKFFWALDCIRDS